MLRLVMSNILGLAGAAVGGVLGFYTFRWLYWHNFYGLMIPGAFLGLGCSLLARHPSVARGVVCGVAALGLSLFTEWHFFPMLADDSFTYFLGHVKDLSPVTYLMLGIGSLIAFWMGKDAGIRGYARSSAPPERANTPREPPPTA